MASLALRHSASTVVTPACGASMLSEEQSTTVVHTDYGLSRTRQTNNLKRDAVLQNYRIDVNDNDKNVNLRCNSGFFLKVASPLLHSLAQQTTTPLTIANVSVTCSNTREALDKLSLLVNNVYFFLLYDLDKPSKAAIKVTVHSHVTQHCVQLQGSDAIDGVKAPLWFTHNILLNAFDKGAATHQAAISIVNNQINHMPSSTPSCVSCNKKISINDKVFTCPACNSCHHKKCTTYKSSNVRNQPKDWKCSSCISLRSAKRARELDNTITCDDETSMPPPKIQALDPPISSGSSSSTSSSPPALLCAISCPSTPLPITSISSGSVLTSVLSPARTNAVYSSSETAVFLPPISRLSVTTSMTSLTTSLVSSLVSYMSPTTTVVTVTPSLFNIHAQSFSPANPVPLTYTPSITELQQSSSPTQPSSRTTSPTPLPPPVPVTSFPARVSAPLKPKTKKTSAPTIALNPRDFEVENLKIQRDALKLKLTEKDSEAKDLKESLEILGTRCRLFEQQRNNTLYESTSATNTNPSVSSSQAQLYPQPLPSAPPATLPPPQPILARDPPLQAVESLLNLEVLKAVRDSRAAPSTPPAPTKHLENLESKLDEFKEEVRTYLICLSEQIANISSSLPRASPLTCDQAQQTDPKTIPLCSTTTGTQCSLPSRSSPAHTLPKPPSKPQREHAPIPNRSDRIRSTRHSISRPSLLGTPPRVSLLGIPPVTRRKAGSPLPLSSLFLAAHGPMKQSAAPKKTQAPRKQNKKKLVNKFKKSKMNKAAPYLPAPTVVFDLLDLPGYLPPPPSVLRPTRNLLEESFNEIDTVVNSFGDENIVSCPNPNPLLPLQNSSHSPRQLGSAFSQAINLEKSFSLN